MQSHKKRITLLGLVALLAFAGIAYSYWSGGGSGTGSGSTATGVSGLTVNQTTTLAAMYPGDSAQTLSGTFSNTNDGPVYVATVTATISSVTKGGVTAVGCDATDFTLSSAAMTVAADVPAGTAVGAWTGATIQFNNKATNQDACKDATVNLAYTIS